MCDANPVRHRRSFGVLIAAILLIFASMFREETVRAQHSPEQQASLQVLMQDLIDDPVGESDHVAPVDYGPGPGKPKPIALASASTTETKALASAADIPIGGTTANVTGVFGPAVTWPIIPIHVVLLPDGRVMNYGTDQKGKQGAQLIYDVWSPTLGTGTNSHRVLPNTTPTDIFCSAQTVLVSGEVLITGGDLTLAGVRNYARNDTNIFSPTANTLTSNTPMSYARWYGSLLTMPDGRQIVFGGIQNQAAPLSPLIPVLTPEIYDPTTRAWSTLTGATSSQAFGLGAQDWYYPRAFVAPGGKIFLIGNNPPLYWITTSGTGSIAQVGSAPPGLADLPTVMFAPGKVLSLRQNQQVVVIDFTRQTPVITQTNPIDQVRQWATGTVLADGTVLITGGSQVKNTLTGVDYTAQIWNPASGRWTAGATATKPRLYHSNALLLPDATVLTGGGGAPGPVTNLNAEIFYPPYLYTSNGAVAVRPTLTSVAPLTVNPGDTLSATVRVTDIIKRLTFVRTGSSTHSQNPDQRFISLSFTQEGANLTAVLPNDSSILVPGFYMLFAINDSGVPSMSTIVLVR